MSKHHTVFKGILFYFFAVTLASPARIVVTFHTREQAEAIGVDDNNVFLGGVLGNYSIVKQYGRRLVLNLDVEITDVDIGRLVTSNDENWLWLVESVELDSIVSLASINIADLNATKTDTGIIHGEEISNSTIHSEAFDNSTSFVESSAWFQWNLADSEPFGIKIEKIWEVTNSTPDVVVAVLDTGLASPARRAFLHLDPGFDFISDPSISLDGDGRDPDSTDFGDAGPECPYSSWHGTKVASVLAAGHDISMGLGMRGVAQNATIMPVRVLGLCSSGYANDASDAIVYSAGGVINGLSLNLRPAKIISMSFTGRGACPSYLQSAINQAISLGSVIVAAAGNEGLPTIHDVFPANCNGVISVGARIRDGTLAAYSNNGASMEAPGGDQYNSIDVLTCSNNEGGSLSPSHSMGTSMAVPHVSGAAAILASSNHSILTSVFFEHVWDVTFANSILPSMSQSNTSQLESMTQPKIWDQTTTAPRVQNDTYQSWDQQSTTVSIQNPTYQSLTQESTTLAAQNYTKRIGNYSGNQMVHAAFATCAPGLYNNPLNVDACLFCASGTYNNGVGTYYGGIVIPLELGGIWKFFYFDAGYDTPVYKNDEGYGIIYVSNYNGVCFATDIEDMCSYGNIGGDLVSTFIPTFTQKSYCFYCEYGYYQSAAAASSCTSQCTFGTYTTGTSPGSTCVTCPYSNKCCRRGSYYPGTGSVCLPCPIGTSSIKVNASSCDPCPAGYATSTTGNLYCDPCQAGFYSTGTGNSQCKSCSLCRNRSFYESSPCNSTSDTVCVSCPSGYVVFDYKTSPGTCRKGYNGFALVADASNKMIRKLDLETNDVTTIGSAQAAAISSVTMSCDGTYALFTVGHALGKIDLTTQNSSIIAGNILSIGFTQAMGTTARFNTPNRIKFSHDCSYLLLSDYLNYAVRKINMSTLNVTRFAGTGVTGTSEGAATSATFTFPTGFAFSLNETFVLVVDNNRIRKITLKTMTVSALVGGTGTTGGYSDGTGTYAKFLSPRGIDISPDGLYALVTDRDNQKIRKIDLTTNTVSTLVSLSSDAWPKAIAIFNNEALVSATAKTDNAKYNVILRMNIASTGVSVIAGDVAGLADGKETLARFNNPNDVFVWTCGYGYYFVDSMCVSCTDSCFDGQYASVACTTYADTVCSPCPACPFGMYRTDCFWNSSGSCIACDSCPYGYGRTDCSGVSAGTCILGSNSFALVVDSGNSAIRKIDLVTAAVTTVGPMSYPSWNIAVSCEGTYAVYAAVDSHVIMKINMATGTSSILAGSVNTVGSNDGTGIGAKFSSPQGITFSNDCKYIFVSDVGNKKIRKIDILNAQVTSIAGNGITGYTDGLATMSTFTNPDGIVSSPDGSFLVITDGFITIRKLTLTGTMRTSTIAGDYSTSGSTDGFGTSATFMFLSYIDISSDGMFLLATDQISSSSMRKIDLTTNEVSTVWTLSPATGVSIMPVDEYALASNGNLVYIFSITSGQNTLVAGSASAGLENNIGEFAQFNTIAEVRVWKCIMDGFYSSFSVCAKCAFECASGVEYESVACTSTTNRVCTPYTTCPTGMYLINSTATSDGTCVAYASCPGGTYNNGTASSMPGCVACTTCAAGYYMSGCTGKFNGVCVLCPTCPTGYVQVPTCGGQSPGVCKIVSSGFALIVDSTNRLMKKINLVTNSVSTIGTSEALLTCDVTMSCDGTYAVYTVGHALMKLNLTTGESTILAGSKMNSGKAEGIGTNARFNTPCRVQMSNDCSYMLVADINNRVVRKVTMSTLNVARIAGMFGVKGYTGGSALSSKFMYPSGIAFSPDGTYVLLADYNKVRKLTLNVGTMKVSDVAGMTTNGGGYVNGVGSNAKFWSLRDIDISPDGTFALVPDRDNHVIRKINLATRSVTTLVSLTTALGGAIVLLKSISIFNNEALVTTTGSGTSVSTYNMVLRVSISTTQVTIMAGGVAGNAIGSGTSARFSNPNAAFVWTCGSGYFLSGSTCSQCSVCDDGYYPVNLCTKYSDAVCAPYPLCPTGKYCSDFNSDGSKICTTCAVCPSGFTRSNCYGTSTGTCIQGSNGFALISDEPSKTLRKIDLVTSNVTSMGSLGVCQMQIESVILSCDGTSVFYMCNYALMKLNISTGSSTVVAGNLNTNGIVNGIGTIARFNAGHDIKMSQDCSYVLIPGSIEIRKVILSNMQVSNIAGSTTSGYSDGTATSSKFNAVTGMAVSPDGTYALITDKYFIRKLTLTGSPLTTSTIAGSSSHGLLNGIGTNARFESPNKIEFSSDGLFALIMDWGCIRKLNISSKAVTTVTSSIDNAAYGMSLFANNLHALFVSSSMIQRVSIASAEVAVLAGSNISGLSDGLGVDAKFYRPLAIYVRETCAAGYYRAGNIPCTLCSTACVAGTSYESVPCTPTTNRVCTACRTCVIGLSFMTSDCTVLANRVCSPLTADCSAGYYNKTTQGSFGTCVACDSCQSGYGRSNCSGKSPGFCITGSNSFALVAESTGKYIRKIDLVTTNVTTIGSIASYAINGVVVSCDGTYAVYTCNHALMKLNLTTNIATVFAGNLATSGGVDNIGTNARFNLPLRLRMSNDCSYILVGDSVNKVIRKVDLNTATVSTVAGTFGALAGCKDGLARNATFSTPNGMAISPSGSYMLLLDDNKVRKITLTGTMMVSTITGNNFSTVGLTGNVDGVGMNVLFSSPREIEISSSGVFALITDGSNWKIRKLDLATNSVSTLLSLAGPYGNSISPMGMSFMPVDSQVLFTSISSGFNRVVSMSTTTGEMTILAGTSLSATVNGKGTQAQFNSPIGISVWKCGGDNVWSNNVCHSPCPACGDGQYSDLFCTCSACSTCPVSTYQTQTCSSTSDTVCIDCDSSCPDGMYQSQTCGPSTDTVCAPCSDCPIGTYQSMVCSATADATCVQCSTCPSGTYQGQACNTDNDTVCIACTVCTNRTFQAQECSSEYGDTMCLPCSECLDSEFQEQQCDPSADTLCSECNTCVDGTHEIQVCNTTSDVTCAPCDACTTGGYARQDCGGNSSGTCVACALCASSGYYNQGCNSTSLGTCVACDVCADAGYYNQGCSGVNPGMCVPCDPCTASGYYKQGCNGTSPGTCVLCPLCDQIGYFNQGCGGTDAGTCVSCVSCTEAGYYNEGCDGISLGACVPCAPCTEACYRQGCGGAIEGTCIACETCPGDGYYRKGCSGNSTGSCARCEMCTVDGYYKHGCIGTSPGVCILCEPCAEAGYYRQGCNGTSAGTCVSCEPCTSGYYMQGCGGTSAGTCVPCGACTGSGYYAVGCTGTSPGTCFPCEPCTQDGFYRQDCGGNSPGTCAECSICTANGYFRNSCGGLNSGSCARCTNIS